jgi:hypothetical protein
MSLTYATTQTAISTLTAIPTTDANFQAIFPNAIDYAESRIYREADLITQDVRDSSGSTSSLNRNFTLPTTIGTFQIVSGINIITPTNTAADSGTRNPLIPVSRDVIDLIWPSRTGAGVPQNFCYLSQSLVSGQTNILLGPWPDNVYTVEVIGKIQPTPLSATNTTTFLTLYLPDVFLMAMQIYYDNYMHLFSAISSEPQAAVTHEAQYQTLLKSAIDFETRKKFAGASWTASRVEPTAVPQRG